MRSKFGGIKSKGNMTEEEKEELDKFVKKSLLANTAAVKSLADSEFTTIGKSPFQFKVSPLHGNQTKVSCFLFF